MPSKSMPTPEKMMANTESLRKPDGRLLLDNSLAPTRTIESVQDPALFLP